MIPRGVGSKDPYTYESIFGGKILWRRVDRPLSVWGTEKKKSNLTLLGKKSG